VQALQGKQNNKTGGSTAQAPATPDTPQQGSAPPLYDTTSGNSSSNGGSSRYREAQSHETEGPIDIVQADAHADKAAAPTAAWPCPAWGLDCLIMDSVSHADTQGGLSTSSGDSSVSEADWLVKVRCRRLTF
jgi:hypothetical protein